MGKFYFRFVCAMLTALFAMGGVGDVNAQDQTFNLTSIQSGISNGTTITQSTSTTENLPVTYSQYRNWGSSDGAIKFSKGGSIALYKFDLSSISNAKGILKSVTFKVDQVPGDNNCYNICLLGYNGGWDKLSNTSGSIKGTVNDKGSFQPLGDKYKDISAKAAGIISVDAKTYIKSAIDAKKTEVSFAVAMNLSRTLSCATSATLEVVYTTAASHSYAVNAVVGNTVIKEIASGEEQEGLEYNVTGIPEFIAQTTDGVNTYYQLSDENVKNNQISYTMGASDETQSITYVENKNIAFFAEVEDAFKSSSSNYVYDKSNTLSGGKGVSGHRTGAQISVSFEVPTLGIYNIAIVHQGNDDRTNNYYVDDLSKVFESAKGSSDADDIHTISTVLTAGSHTIAFAANYNLTAVFDYVTVTRVADAPAISVTINADSHLASYSNDYAVTVPEDVVIYKASEVSENTVTLTKVATNVIPAKTGVILYSAETGEKTLTYGGEADASAYEGNALKATGNSTVKAGDNIYALLAGTQSLAKVQSGIEIPANKAYLEVTGSGAKLNFVIDGQVTGISSVKSEEGRVGDEPAYNLAGQRVGKNYKGIVVKNGRKYIVK